MTRRLSWARDLGFAFALGALSVLGFAPFHLFPLPILLLAPLIGLWCGRGPAACARGGFAYGLGFFGFGVSWVFVSLHDYGHMPAALAAIATFLLCAVLALFPAAAGWLQAQLAVPLWVRAAALIPSLWMLTEWFRGWLLTGFPWLALGYSQAPPSALGGFAPIVGVYGISLASAISAGLAFLIFERARRRISFPLRGARRSLEQGSPPSGDATAQARVEPAVITRRFRPLPGRTYRLRWQALLRRPQAKAGMGVGNPVPSLNGPPRRTNLIAPGLALTAIWLGGYLLKQIEWTQPMGEPLKVSLLQGNIPQDIKWAPENTRKSLDVYIAQALNTDARLIVLPETAFPLFHDQVPEQVLDRLRRHARSNDGDILIGLPEYAPTAGERGSYFNSVFSLGASPAQVYRKVHLVPFGEFIPPAFGWVLNWLQIPLSDFSRGSIHQQPLDVAGQRVAVNICYEDVFGEEIIRQLPAATLLVNVSNVAWFGDSIAPWQHLQIAQMRALETGRYMLRATNTGMTAVVGPNGEVLAQAPKFSEAVLTHEARGYTGTTPYVRFGNGIALAIALTLLAVACGTTATR